MVSRKDLLKRKTVSLSEIAPNPDNPRVDYGDDSLGDSIQDLGLLDPIKLRPISEDEDFPHGTLFAVVDGDRRFNIAIEIYPVDHKLKVGKDIKIVDLTREEAYDANVALNMQRQNYNLYEECKIVKYYLDKGLSQRAIGKKCNRSLIWVQDRINFIEADSDIKEQILDGELNLSYYRVTSRSQPEVSAGGQSEDAGYKADATEEEANAYFDEHSDKVLMIAGGEITFATADRKLHFLAWLQQRNTEILSKKLDEEFAEVPTAFKPFRFYEMDQEALDYLLKIDAAGIEGHYKLQSKRLIGDNSFSVEIEWFDDEQEKHFDFYLQQRKEKAEPKANEEERKMFFTHEQIAAFRKEFPSIDDAMVRTQVLDDDYIVSWRNYAALAYAIEWLLKNKDKYPLSRKQLKKYTDLTDEEIQEQFEDTIEIQAEESLSLPAEKKSVNPREAMMFVTQQEYDSLLPSLRTLISEKELNKDGRINIYFYSWGDHTLVQRWLNPSQQWKDTRFNFSARTFASTNSNDILITDKMLKDHFPEIYQELKVFQNHAKKINQLSCRSLDELTKSALRLRSLMKDLIDDLLLNKSRRRIAGAKEQCQKICQQCLQPKWLEKSIEVCSACTMANNHKQPGNPVAPVKEEAS